MHSPENTENSASLSESGNFPVIENIEILELIGRGGMGLVYKARQTVLDRIVAVKVLAKEVLSGESDLRRFQLEAKLTSNLSHPNIMQTLAYGVSAKGEPFIVMEFVDGISLSQLIANEAPLSYSRFKSIFLPVLSALQYAHEKGVVHRDIKPENIMVCRENDGSERVLLLDFGVAKIISEEVLPGKPALTSTGKIIGSPNYMSPEQCQGKALDGRSDIYSLSCVMFYALSKELPFAGENQLEVMLKHSREDVPTVEQFSRKMEISEKLASLVLWGLAKSPADRPQSASQLAHKLQGILDQITLDRSPRLKASPGSEKKKFGFVLFLVFAIFISGVLAFRYCSSLKKNGESGASFFLNNRASFIPKARKLLEQAQAARDAGNFHDAQSYAGKALMAIAHPYPTKNQSRNLALDELEILNDITNVCVGLRGNPIVRLNEMFETVRANNDSVWSESEMMRCNLDISRLRGYYRNFDHGPRSFLELIRFYMRTDHLPEAERLVSEELSFLVGTDSTSGSAALLSLSCDMASAYLADKKGDHKAALALADQCFSRLKEVSLSEIHRSDMYIEFGHLFKDLKAYQKAESSLGEAVKSGKEMLGFHTETLISATILLSECYQSQRKYDEAIDSLKKLDAILTTHHWAGDSRFLKDDIAKLELEKKAWLKGSVGR